MSYFEDREVQAKVAENSTYFEDKGDTDVVLGQTAINRSAALGALASEGDLVDNYRNIKTEIETTGRSSVLETLDYQWQVEQDEIDAAVVDNILMDTALSQEDKLGAVTALNAQREAEGRRTANLQELAISNNLETSIVPTEGDEKVHLRLLDTAEDIAKWNSAANELHESFGAELAKQDKGILSLSADTAALVLSPGSSALWKSMAEAAFPESTSIGDYLLEGRVKDNIKRELNKLPVEERAAKIQLMAEALRENSGLVQDRNELEEFLKFGELVSFGDTTSNYSAFEEGLDNVLGILEVFIIGDVLRGAKALLTSKADTLDRSSPLSTTMSSDRTKSVELMEAALAEEKRADVQEAIGASKEDIVDNAVLPKAEGTSVRTGPDMNAALAEEFENIFGPDTQAVGYAARRLKVTTTWKDEWQRTLEDSPSFHLSKSTVVESEDTLWGTKMKAVVGRSPENGFATLEEAKQAAKTFKENSTGAAFLYRNENDNLITTTKDMGEGEYFIQFTKEEVYNPADVGQFADNELVGIKGPKARYSDVSAVFNPNEVSAGNWAVFQEARLREDLNTVGGDYYALSNSPKIQTQVAEVLDKGDREGIVYNNVQLAQAFSNLKEGDKARAISAYHAIRKNADLLYLANNRRLRNQLQQDRMMHLSVATGDTTFDVFARPLKGDVAKREDIRTVYDPETATIVSLSNIDEVYAEGKVLAKSKGKIGVGKGATNYVVASVDNFHELPAQVLSYRTGYLPRLYNSNFVIRQELGDVIDNGRKVTGSTRAIKFSNSIKDAKAEMARLAEANPKSVYRIETVKELAQQTDDLDYEFFDNTGQLFFSKRRESEVEVVGGSRALRGIGESMQRANAMVGRRMGIDEYINDRKQKWINTYGDLLPQELRGTFPSSSKVLQRPSDVDKLDKWKEAVTWADRINKINGAEEGLGTAAWREGIIRTGLFFGRQDNKMSGWLSDKMLDPTSTFPVSINYSPIDLLKSSAYLAYIVGSPVRQVLLGMSQTSTYLGVDHGLKYLFNGAKGGYVRDYASLQLGLLAKNLDTLPTSRFDSGMDVTEYQKSLMAAGAKVAGKSEKEFTDFVEAFHKSGLIPSIDGHQFASILSAEREVNAVGINNYTRVAGNMAKLPIRTFKKMGFTLGEYHNLSTAYLVARNKWAKNNKGKNPDSPEATKQIAGDAGNISLVMNRSGTIGYHKGLASAFMQFMSIQQKHAQVVLRALEGTPFFGKIAKRAGIGKLSSKAFSEKEARRIAMMWGGLFGSAGWGIQDAYKSFRDETGIKPPEVVDDLLVGGATEVMLNNWLQSELDVSQSIAPASGFTTMMDSILLTPWEGLQAQDLLGASQVLPRTIGSVYENGAYIMGLASIDQLEGEDLANAWDDTARFAAFYNNYLKAHWMLKYGKSFTKSGNPVADASRVDAYARMLFSIPTKGELDVQKLTYDTLRDVYGSKSNQKSELDALADEYYQRIRTWALQAESGEITSNVMKQYMKSNSLLFSVLPTQDRNYVMERVVNKGIYSDLDEDGGARLINILMRVEQKQRIPNAETLLNKIDNAADFGGKEELKTWLKAVLDTNTILDDVQEEAREKGETL